MREAAEFFEAERATLMALSYRMLGERALAEDVVQESWLRFAAVRFDELERPGAWLRRVATNIALDVLRSAQRQRESYVGPWLPEPLIVEGDNAVERDFILAQECELALLWAMERLGPVERAAFVLREAFDADYGEIARTLGRSEAACRQLVSRAHRRLQASGPRFDVAEDEAKQALERFFFAVTQDHDAALRLLAQEAVALTDGGGKVSAAKRVLTGPQEIVQVFAAVWAKEGRKTGQSFALVRANGRPALAQYHEGRLETLSLVSTASGGLINWIYVMRNPGKLLSAQLSDS